MEEADELCEKLDLWLEKQDRCIKKLLALAEELEDLHLGSNAVQLVGNAAAVGGFAVSGIATLATICTGGLAAPLTAPLLVAGIGTAVSLAPKAIESGLSHRTIKEAKKRIKDVEEIRDTIQTLMNELNAKCASQGRGASSDDESDECEVTTQIMGALARKYGIDVPLDLLRRFNETIFFNQQSLGRRGPDVALTCMTGAAASFILSIGLKTAGKEMAKDIGFISMKTVIKETALVVGSFAGLAVSISDMIKNLEEIKDNRTEASRSLRTAAREMKENSGTLRNTIEAQRKIIKKLSEFRKLLEDLGEYSSMLNKTAQEFLNYIKATCPDDTVRSWVDENQIYFLNVFRFLRDYLLKPLEEEIKKRNRRHVHIVFVAHGSITAEFIPAALLVPPPSIEDTILYSPWNCYIDARAASGIANGRIKPHHRIFYDQGSGIIVNGDHLSQRWNSMRESTHAVPQILLGPVTPCEPVWKEFVKLGGYVYINDRIIIPYLYPDKSAPHIPFFVFIYVASFVLMFIGVKATVHLAACLGRGETIPMWRECAEQYAYAPDDTVMSMKVEASRMDPLLRRAFRMMFDNRQ